MSDLITTEGSFEWAMLQLKAGKRVARKGWNGKGMYLLRNPGLMGQSVQEGDYRAQAGVEVGTEFDFLPNIEMCNAQGNFVPWVSSQVDVAAMDWISLNDTANAILIIDMISGVGKNGQPYVGFSDSNYGNYGSCDIVEKNIDIDDVAAFYYWFGANYLGVCVYLDSDIMDEFQVMVEKAKFEVTVKNEAFLFSFDSIKKDGNMLQVMYKPHQQDEFVEIISVLNVEQRYCLKWLL